MFEFHKTTITIEQPLPNISYIDRAFKNSLVFLHRPIKAFNQNYNQKIVHVSSEGKILFVSEEDYEDVDSFTMIDFYTVAILNFRKKRIEIICLENY
jgi:hypothetical protein